MPALVDFLRSECILPTAEKTRSTPADDAGPVRAPPFLQPQPDIKSLITMAILDTRIYYINLIVILECWVGYLLGESGAY